MKTTIVINGVNATRNDWTKLYSTLIKGEECISRISIEGYVLRVDTEPTCTGSK